MTTTLYQSRTIYLFIILFFFTLNNIACSKKENDPPVTTATAKYQTSLALGNDYSCVNLASGEVKCWGDGRFGRTGHAAPQLIGDEASDMGDNLPAILTLGNNLTIAQIDAGDYHTCAPCSPMGD